MMYIWKEIYYYFYIEKHKFQHIFDNIFTLKQFLEILSKTITWKLFDNKFWKLCKLQRMNSFSSANIVPKAKGAQIPCAQVSPEEQRFLQPYSRWCFKHGQFHPRIYDTLSWFFWQCIANTTMHPWQLCY